jgi:hypothetical protein
MMTTNHLKTAVNPTSEMPCTSNIPQKMNKAQNPIRISRTAKISPPPHSRLPVEK